MKKILLFTSLLFVAAFAQADVTVEQKIESSMINGNSVTKIKGDMVRIDTPAPGVGQISMIVDIAKGKSTTLMPAQKMAMQMDLGVIKDKAQSLLQGQAGKIGKPTPTGKTEKIGDWTADIYEWNAGGIPLKLWIAKDFPNAAAIKEQMNKLSKATMGGALDLSQLDLPGMVVKTEMTAPQMTMSTTLVSVKEAPIADSEFIVPPDFKVMALPGGLGGGAPDAGQ